MSYQVLARKWRPQTFAAMVGQEHAVKTMMNAITNDRVHHAWLITGTRGVGKTTLARVFAKSLNCMQGMSNDPCGVCASCEGITKGNFVDLIEVDAASKTGVEDTRQLLETLNYAANIGRYRIFVIDEVHMFSNASFNALLKSLEEPPKHVKFIFATTEAHKIPITVLSRCIQLKLLRLEVDQIDQHLQQVLKQEQIHFELPATHLIAYSAHGSMRDALSLTDQMIAMGNNQVLEAVVRQVLGLSAENAIIETLQALAKFQGPELLTACRKMLKESGQLSALLHLCLEYFHQLTLYKQLGEGSLNLNRVRDLSSLRELADWFSLEELHLLYHMLQKGQQEVVHSANPQGSFEMLLLRMLAFRPKDAKRDQQAPKNTAAPSQQPKQPSTTPSVAQPKTDTDSDQKTQYPQSNNQWQTWLLDHQRHFGPSVWHYLKQSQLNQFQHSPTEIKLELGFDASVNSYNHDHALPKVVAELQDLWQTSVAIQTTTLAQVDTLQQQLKSDLLSSVEKHPSFDRVAELLQLDSSQAEVHLGANQATPQPGHG